MLVSAHRSARAFTALVLALGVGVGLGAAPAEARHAPRAASAPAVHAGDPRSCPLSRIGTQYVRCDDLTGAGAPAPSWVGVGRYCPLTRICGEPLRLDGAGTATLNGLTALRNCPLTRIGTQLLRCDNLTGAGARAPWWVPEY